MSDIEHVLNETQEPAPALDLDGTTDLDDNSVPQLLRPGLLSRDIEQSAARRTRSANRALFLASLHFLVHSFFHRFFGELPRPYFF